MLIHYIYTSYLSFIWKGWEQIQFSTMLLKIQCLAYIFDKQSTEIANWVGLGWHTQALFLTIYLPKMRISIFRVSEQLWPISLVTTSHTAFNITSEPFPKSSGNATNARASLWHYFCQYTEAFYWRYVHSLIREQYILEWCMNHMCSRCFSAMDLFS